MVPLPLELPDAVDDTIADFVPRSSKLARHGTYQKVRFRRPDILIRCIRLRDRPRNMKTAMSPEGAGHLNWGGDHTPPQGTFRILVSSTLTRDSKLPRVWSCQELGSPNLGHPAAIDTVVSQAHYHVSSPSIHICRLRKSSNTTYTALKAIHNDRTTPINWHPRPRVRGACSWYDPFALFRCPLYAMY